MNGDKPSGPPRSARDWDARYGIGDTPWDIGRVDAHLLAAADAGRLSPCRMLEVGCGTGTDAVWFASRGFTVTAIDIAPLAIERARARAAQARVEVDFRVASAVTEGAAFDLVYDCGCFHTLPTAEERAAFATRVSRALRPEGRWLSISGSTDGPPRDHGPPRLSAETLMIAIEPGFEIRSLTSDLYDADIPTPARAWVLWAQRRA